MNRRNRNITTKKYLPIEDYGVVGNLRTVALVGKNGSIDWCCFPGLDDASVFGALLDVEKGGYFKIAPAPDVDGGVQPDAFDNLECKQDYLPDTNILVTRFSKDQRDLLKITDFMPLGGQIEGTGGSHAPPEIHRILEGGSDPTMVDVEWAPRFNYARALTRISRLNGCFVAEGAGARMSLSDMPGARVEDGEGGHILKARFPIEPGGKRVVVARWGDQGKHANPEDSESLLKETADAWKQWICGQGEHCAREWAGEWLAHVNRAGLVFKLLTNADTGAIAAAATTSLPEVIGGVRNWDYRFAWIRDAAMTAQALVSLGHEKEAAELIRWMEDVSAKHADGLELLVMYGLHGEDEIPEETLDHLEGYRQSKPVRIGNGAAEQFQLEVYGELVNSVYEMSRRGQTWSGAIRRFICHVVDHTCLVWQRPDSGIWEMRDGTSHFTYSKVMAWVALDRAVRLVHEYGFEGDADRWSRTCKEISDCILEHGYCSELQSFTMTFDSRDVDAALLRIPLMEFLPGDDPRVQGTIDMIQKELMHNDLVYRYRIDDNLPGEEGAFGLCTFWMVDALSLSGRLSEAERIFRNMLGRANSLGLFSEEIDPHTDRFLGNYPQAFTHIGLINSALYLVWAKGRNPPDYAPIGTVKHRKIMGRKYSDTLARPA